MRSLFAFLLLFSLTSPAAADEPHIDVDKLPIDIARITQELKSVTVLEERDGLRLRYFLNINAPAPPLNIVINPDGTDSWLVGPVPHTAPTHREFMEFVTPQQWRTPPADLGALFTWLAEKASKK